jgi:hypothetical protein
LENPCVRAVSAIAEPVPNPWDQGELAALDDPRLTEPLMNFAGFNRPMRPASESTTDLERLATNIGYGPLADSRLARTKTGAAASSSVIEDCVSALQDGDANLRGCP